MRNKVFFGLGLLTMCAFPFVVNAQDVTQDITLTKDVSDGLVVKAGSNVKINLGGFDVTNEKGGHTIVIEKGATATITGTGNVSNSFNKKAPVYNDGTVTISGGNYTRHDAAGNSFYVLLNHGTMTINGGKYVTQNGISSLIDNGWYTPEENKAGTMATLTISDGTFEMYNNDKYIKNDDYGIMVVNGGTFNMYKPSSAVIGNMGFYTGKEKVTVNDGTFNYYGTGNVNAKGYAIWDYDWNKDGYTDNSTTIVNGGTYNLKGDSVAGITNGTLANNKKEFKVIGSDEYVIVKENELVKKVDIDAITGEEVNESDKALIDKAVANKKYEVAGFYNIDLFNATANGLKVEQITEADGSVKIKLSIPKAVAKVKDGYKRVYYVIRVHDGVVTILDTTNNGDGTISFKSDKFSTYSLVYKDTKIQKAENPETFDNGSMYIALAVVSLIGLSGSRLLLRRMN